MLEARQKLAIYLQLGRITKTEYSFCCAVLDDNYELQALLDPNENLTFCFECNRRKVMLEADPAAVCGYAIAGCNASNHCEFFKPQP